MPKRARAAQSLDIQLDQRSVSPLYKQLYERLRAAVLAGALETGARLPSTRTLAAQLGVSRNTTALAYEMLALEGYIVSRVGDGARVARLFPAVAAPTAPHIASAPHPLHAPSTDPTSDPRHLPARLPARRARAVCAQARAPLFAGDAPEPASGSGLFLAGQPDVTLFPYAAWASLVTRHARRSLPAVARYQPAQGYAPLREAIAAHIGVTRGVRCTAGQIIITAGAQGAMDLAARVLLDSGDAAWVEDPGYPNARAALLAASARLVPVPVDAEGLDVAAGRAQAPEARLAVITPSHQFPTAVTMSLARRLALLDWSREAGAWLIEDDYDSEFRYGGRPLEALQGLDRDGRALYVGTFSKALLPTLRLGYLVAPPDAGLLDALLAMRRAIDTHPPLLEQLALADFMASGQFARGLRAARLVYRERRDALLVALRAEAGDLLTVVAPDAGLHLAAWLPDGMSGRAAVQRGRAAGLRIESFSQPTASGGQRDGLILGFSGGAPDALRAGARALAQALRG